MLCELVRNLVRIRIEIEHCAHALNDVFESRIVWELEGETEKVAVE